jgi:hypothetical protein
MCQTALRLTYLVIDGNEWVVRREGTRGALAVNEEGAHLAVNAMLFHLGNVVGDVINHMHV